MSCFVNQELTERDVIVRHYGMLVYQLIVDALNARGVQGSIAMVVTPEQFYTSSVRLSK